MFGSRENQKENLDFEGESFRDNSGESLKPKTKIYPSLEPFFSFGAATGLGCQSSGKLPFFLVTKGCCRAFGWGGEPNPFVP